MILVVDLDGTVANNDHRLVYIQKEKGQNDWVSFYDPEKISHDTPYPEAQAFFQKLYRTRSEYHLVFLTGRPERTRAISAWWLRTHYGIETVRENPQFLRSEPPGRLGMLVMKSDKDYRPASIYKEDEVGKLTVYRPKGSFIFIDDDTRCYDMFWKYGLVFRPPEAWAALRGAL